MDTLLIAAGVYMLVALIVLLINAFVAGYNETDIIFKDAVSSVLWPIALMTLLGIIARIAVQQYNKKENK